jgi:RND family efflux transporter MFP subunit
LRIALHDFAYSFAFNDMKNILLTMALAIIALAGCHSNDAAGGHSNDHAHDANGNHIKPAESQLEPLAFTLYSDKTELFVEFKPLVVGQESRFAAHFTALGKLFKAVSEGSVTLSLVQGNQVVQSITAEKPEVPGIFRLRMSPNKPGIFQLVFDIKTPNYSDKIQLENIEVFADEKTALSKQEPTEESGTDISYLKEQAWKVEFANEPARIRPFSEVVQTTGQVMSAPGDEIVLTAQINGIVTYAASGLVVGSLVKTGEKIFTIRSNEAVQSNLSTAVQQAENDLATAQKQFDRASLLVKDKIVSEKEFLEAKLRLENAQTALANLSVSRDFNRNKQTITVPLSGYIKSVLVENGSYVQAGQPLATIAKNKRLLIKADVSQTHFSKIGSFTAANFRSSDGIMYNTTQLNGKIVSTGKSVSSSAPFLPVYFEIDNTANFIPGAAVEVYLLSKSGPALVIPVSALLEEQGVFFAYVQTEGESFQKRELKLGASDGEWVHILSGITEGERVVTTGAYQIKLSTASGTMPAHGHEH